MIAPRYTVDDFNTQAAYESHHERTYAMLRQAAETERAREERPAYEGFPEGISDSFCQHSAVAKSQYNTTVRALAAEVLRLRGRTP